jgi:hypothetical protein
MNNGEREIQIEIPLMKVRMDEIEVKVEGVRFATSMR